MIELIKELYKEDKISINEVRGWLDALRITLDDYLYITT